jgi:hypothetical protein
MYSIRNACGVRVNKTSATDDSPFASHWFRLISPWRNRLHEAKRKQPFVWNRVHTCRTHANERTNERNERMYQISTVKRKQTNAFVCFPLGALAERYIKANSCSSVDGDKTRSPSPAVMLFGSKHGEQNRRLKEGILNAVCTAQRKRPAYKWIFVCSHSFVKCISTLKPV